MQHLGFKQIFLWQSIIHFKQVIILTYASSPCLSSQPKSYTERWNVKHEIKIVITLTLLHQYLHFSSLLMLPLQLKGQCKSGRWLKECKWINCGWQQQNPLWNFGFDKRPLVKLKKGAMKIHRIVICQVYNLLKITICQMFLTKICHSSNIRFVKLLSRFKPIQGLLLLT